MIVVSICGTRCIWWLYWRCECGIIIVGGRRTVVVQKMVVVIAIVVIGVVGLILEQILVALAKSFTYEEAGN